MSHRLPPLASLALRTTLVFTALIGVPSVILAKPAAQEPRPASAVASVVEAEGWTAAAPKGSVTAPGAVMFVDGLGVHTVVLSGCVPPAAMETRSLGGITGDLFGKVKAAIESSPEWGGAGAAVPRTFVGLDHSSIGRSVLRPTEACMAELDRIGGLSSVVLVSDALVANFGDGWQAMIAYRSAPLSLVYDSGARAAAGQPAGESEGADVEAAAVGWPMTTGSAGYALRLVLAGRYAVGCTDGQRYACEPDERPARTVTLSRSVWVGETEVTQGLFARVTGRRPSRDVACGDNCPVESVSWFDAVQFANDLSEQEGLQRCYVVDEAKVAWPAGPACTGYRLPTEAEWEVAARAGHDFVYAGSNDVREVGWTTVDGENHGHPVGRKKANAYGLLDMTGNVSEWVWDWYDGKAPPATLTIDPTGAASGEGRAVRGGNFRSVPELARVSRRDYFSPKVRNKGVGFRLVRTVPEEG